MGNVLPLLASNGIETYLWYYAFVLEGMSNPVFSLIIMLCVR